MIFFSSFTIALLFNTIVITFQAYGNVTLDCTIVAFFAHSKIQLQMVRYNLEHLVDRNWAELDTKINTASVTKTFKDVEDAAFGELLRKRVAHCVEHYKLIVW